VRRAAACSLVLLAACSAARAQEPAFDASAFEKKPFEIGGYVEAKQEHLALNPDGAFYQLGDAGASGRESLDRSTATLQLAGTLRHGIAAFDFRTNSAAQRDPLGHASTNTLYEAALSLRSDPRATVEAGKRALRWGKGYAWNPIGFVERPKDPNDPNLAREGLWMADGDFVFSPGGTVQTVALTPVLLPVNDHTNADFGAHGHLNPTLKIYALVRDVDLDFAWQAAGSRPARIGADFSTNLASNLEVHGEWAHSSAAPRPVVDGAGQVTTHSTAADSWLLGLRHLSEQDLTTIAEVYRNVGGYSPDQMRSFYAFADAAFRQARQTGDGALLRRAQTLASSGYGRPNPGTDYFYLRMQQKDAFGIVYFQPALTAIANLDDHSYQVTPELLYTTTGNLELRARLYTLHGSEGSEFGEKQTRRKLEVYLRYYF
jgi:hypothetical protein